MKMHPIEATLYEKATQNGDWHLDELGGINAISSQVKLLGNSPMMPLLLNPLIHAWNNSQSDQKELFKTTFFQLLEITQTDFILIETIDILTYHNPLPDDSDELFFMALLKKASQLSLSGFSRSIALDGAFRWANKNRRWQFRLLDLFLGLMPDDNKDFLRHSAKIIGIAYTHWKEEALIDKLNKLTLVDYARPEATFELGMVYLSKAISENNKNTSIHFFEESKKWFEESIFFSEENPEASLYYSSINLLLEFNKNSAKEILAEQCSNIKVNIFELYEKFNQSSPTWLGSRYLEVICWGNFSNSINNLLYQLDNPGWWEPTVIIEKELLSVYHASRTLLNRNQSGAIESLISPRITNKIKENSYQIYLIKTWLEKNKNHELANEAEFLISQVENLDSPPLIEAESNNASLSATINEALLKNEPKKVLHSIIENAFNLSISNLTACEINILEQCKEKALGHIDYKNNTKAQQLFDAVLFWLTRFVANRLELSRAHDPSSYYLFEQKDGSLPHESELQLDFYRWLTTNAIGVDLEPPNVGGGRADIRLNSGPESLIIEVKREDSNCSFDSLYQNYSAQTTDYQNTGIRLGVLLVLDLTISNREGTPHMSTLFEIREVNRSGESIPRLILIVKVPGRRKLPSELTKLAKKIKNH